MNRAPAAALLALILVLLLACGRQSRDTDSSTFRFNISGGLTSLDPAFARNQSNTWLVNNLFDGLVRLDSNTRIVPAIAESWAISPDGLRYRFRIREGLFFHDDPCFPEERGRAVNAHDVAYSFHRIIDPAVASPGSWIFAGKVDPDSPFVAMGDTVFELRLAGPFMPMLGILSMPYCSVVPQEAVAHYGNNFRSRPVGTGPYRLERWTEDEALIMTRHSRYFEGSPAVERVVVSFIEDKGMEFLAFLDGQLDMVSDIDAGLKDLVLTLDGDLHPRFHDEVALLRAPYLNTEYLGFVTDPALAGPGNPVLLPEVRRAINLGFDRKAMIRYLRNNKGIPATRGMVPPALPGFDGEAGYGYRYDPEQARQLLADAGFPGGAELPPVRLYAPPAYMDLAEFIQNQVQRIGIRIELEVTQGALLRTRMEKGEAPFFRGSWIADYPDAESYLALFFSGYGAPPNYTRFHLPAFDSLYNLAVQEPDDSLRTSRYRAMDSLAMEHAPVVPLFYDEVYRFVRPGIRGLQPNAMNVLDLRFVQKP